MTDDQKTPNRPGANEVDRAIYRLLHETGHELPDGDFGDNALDDAVEKALKAYGQMRFERDNLAATVAAIPDAHHAANLAHARAERDRLRQVALHAAAECHRRKWKYEDEQTFNDLHEIGEMLRPAAFGGAAPAPGSSRRAQESGRSAERVARLFHEVYEDLAPMYGYQTREASAKPWAEVPEQNRLLMIHTAARVLAMLDLGLSRLPDAERPAGEPQAAEPA